MMEAREYVEEKLVTVLMEVVVIQYTKNLPSLVTFALSILPSRSMFSSTRSSTGVSSSESFGVLETDIYQN